VRKLEEPAEPVARTPFLTGAAGALPSRTVAVLGAIKHAILTGELKPGQSLVETDLAAVLGVSKTPVREALKTLAGAGLVTMSPYRGAVVRMVDDEHARHIYDLRLILEPEALGRAIAAGHDWRAARLALQRAATAADQAERSLANRDFHRELYAGCGNPLLTGVLDDLRDQTALVSAAAWRHDPAASRDQAANRETVTGTPSAGQPTPSWEREAEEHMAVLGAAEAGEARLAAGLLRAHIESFVRRNFPDSPTTELPEHRGEHHHEP
jgi:DNA-binding GntR family transcriptional regulator